ncbi:MAG: chorismate synthase [Thermoplasmata archaeon]|nr:MAG: chorismate synthase [Thermoplasmata archaeon]
MNSYGRFFRVTNFGESHGASIGVTLDGLPAGVELSEEDIQRDLELRSPGKSEISTPRVEADSVEILSGLFNGRSTGAPITMIIRNENIDSSGYDKNRDIPRPGHADYTAWVKYQGYNDFRGGGPFSGRATAALVMAGAVAKKLLKQMEIDVAASTIQIGDAKITGELSFDEIKANRWSNEVRCAQPETAARMKELILQAKSDKDSVGGIIECIIQNVPAGVGEPFFCSVESEISKLMFSIPGVKGVEFGSGFKCAEMKGSEHNDPFTITDGKIITETNNAGGILGGITSGMPVVFRVAIKPTSSIQKEQKSINLKTREAADLQLEGRFDPCIVPRAVIVVEAAAAIAMADLVLSAKSELKT